MITNPLNACSDDDLKEELFNRGYLTAPELPKILHIRKILGSTIGSLYEHRVRIHGYQQPEMLTAAKKTLTYVGSDSGYCETFSDLGNRENWTAFLSLIKDPQQ